MNVVRRVRTLSVSAYKIAEVVERIKRLAYSCKAAHISLSRSAVQMRGFLIPLASS
jgi:hypothetical protein